jgi:hypothetical protein
LLGAMAMPASSGDKRVSTASFSRLRSPSGTPIRVGTVGREHLLWPHRAALRCVRCHNRRAIRPQNRCDAEIPELEAPGWPTRASLLADKPTAGACPRRKAPHLFYSGGGRRTQSTVAMTMVLRTRHRSSQTQRLQWQASSDYTPLLLTRARLLTGARITSQLRS